VIIKIFIPLFIAFFPLAIVANTISGLVKDKHGNTLPFASVLIKGTTRGTTANSKGKYVLQLEPGVYELVCQHIGYQSIEKKVQLNNSALTIDFILEEQQYTLKEAIVQSGGEDPAYAIIRKAIAARENHLNSNKKFQCKVYIKGQLQLRDFPAKFLGKKVDFEDGDTSKRKMLFLSESEAEYAVDGRKKKVTVVSTKVSGQSNGFGFASPNIISLYENLVQIGSGINPRGFISPIADNALSYYKYKLQGSFFENGKMINRIKVIPKRKYEPLFNGSINIIEDDWQLQGVDLTLFKENQVQFLDTLHIEQLYVPMKDQWVIKQQVIYPAGKFLRFDFFGNFLQVYDQFDTDPVFGKGFFDHTIITYTDSSNKKTLQYWDSIRPVPLLETEIKDYLKKDSLEQLRKSPLYLDSVDRKRNKPSFATLFFTGYTYNRDRYKSSISVDPLLFLASINYNPVEGSVSRFGFRYNKTVSESKSFSIGPEFRYGFHNSHLNAYLNSMYNFGKRNTTILSFSGGKKVFQLNNENPISELNNTLSTYYWNHNYMKIYEAVFAKASVNQGFGNGFTGNAVFEYQDRQPLDNTIESLHGKSFAPNYPTELMASNFQEHKAFIAILGISWQAGSRYIQLPNKKFSIGSRYPLLNLSVTEGVNGIFGSDVQYTKWKLSIKQRINLKLGGSLVYKAETGGFLNADKFFIQDYQHFSGNQTAIASEYLNSFQLLPYYQYSNTAHWYGCIHTEYHLNGLLSNKIPVMRKLNWFFVLGGNALYLEQHQPYYEALFSIENIFRLFRVDYVRSFEQNGTNTQGIRVNIPFFRDTK